MRKIKYIDIGVEKIGKIYHIADVHIRNLKRHKANVEVYLTNSVGIGEHSDILEAIETELDAMSKYEERIQILEKYFEKK